MSTISRTVAPFFATQADLAGLLSSLLKVRPLQFVEAGLFDTSEYNALPWLEDSESGSHYLVGGADLVIKVRVVPQKAGGQKYAIDQILNPETVVLAPGGLVEPHCLVAGQLGTATEEKSSMALYREIVSLMRLQFTKLKAYYVGKEAAILLDQGGRLTAHPKGSRLYDLTRS